MSSSKLYEEILDILVSKFDVSRVELERIINSQFRVIKNSIGKKEAEVSMLTYLGKIVPSKSHKQYVQNKKAAGNI